MPRYPWKEGEIDITPKNEAVDGSQFFGLVNYTILRAPEEHLDHVSRPPALSETNPLSILDTTVSTHGHFS